MINICVTCIRKPSLPCQILTMSPTPYPHLRRKDIHIALSVGRGLRPANWGSEVCAKEGRFDALDVPPALKVLVGQCWATQSDRRPKSALDILDRLHSIFGQTDSSYGEFFVRTNVDPSLIRIKMQIPSLCLQLNPFFHTQALMGILLTCCLRLFRESTRSSGTVC